MKPKGHQAVNQPRVRKADRGCPSPQSSIRSLVQTRTMAKKAAQYPKGEGLDSYYALGGDGGEQKAPCSGCWLPVEGQRGSKYVDVLKEHNLVVDKGTSVQDGWRRVGHRTRMRQ